MILAAGRGERMRPLTDQIPKPLLPVAGRPLIVHWVERLVHAGISDLVVNHSWLGDQIEAALGDGAPYGARIRYSPEPFGRLDVAGGIINALALLGDAPFIAVNADVWTDYSLERLEREPVGSFHLVMVDNPAPPPGGRFRTHRRSSRARCRAAAHLRRHRFVSCDPVREARAGTAAPVPLLEQAIRGGEATGEHYRGDWVDVGTPERLHELDQRIRQQATGNR